MIEDVEKIVSELDLVMKAPEDVAYERLVEIVNDLLEHGFRAWELENAIERVRQHLKSGGR